jgi:hypothetical protein
MAIVIDIVINVSIHRSPHRLLRRNFAGLQSQRGSEPPP